MKKFFLSLLPLVAAISINAAPITATYNLPASCSTNLPTLMGTNNSFTLLSAILTSAANNAGSITVYDWYTNSTTYVIPAYTSVGSFATNYITLWTNFYGVTNYMTNIALIDYTNSVTQATNNLQARYVWSSPTNASTSFMGLNNRFQFGMFVTNTSSGTATLTIQYQY